MRLSVHLKDCPAAARVVAVASRLIAVIESDDAAAKKGEEEGDGDDSRRGSVEDGRTAMATALGILVGLLEYVLFVSVSMLLAVVARNGDGLKGEEKKMRQKKEAIQKRKVGG